MLVQIGAFQAPYGASAAGETFADDPVRNGNQAMQSLAVVAQLGHSDYNDVTLEFDFALLKLKEPANATFLPVPLNGQDGRDIVAGYNATKSDLFPIGFGTTSSGGSATTSLTHVDVNFVTQPDCNADYSDAIKDVMMCAADVGQDSC